MSTYINISEFFSVEDGVEKVDVKSYKSLVGSLMYINTTWCDIVQVVSSISRFMECSSHIHVGESKITFRYLYGTSNFGIWYTLTDNFGFWHLVCFNI